MSLKEKILTGGGECPDVVSALQRANLALYGIGHGPFYVNQAVGLDAIDIQRRKLNAEASVLPPDYDFKSWHTQPIEAARIAGQSEMSRQIAGSDDGQWHSINGIIEAGVKAYLIALSASPAAVALKDKEQLDHEGVMVGVSRQALDEILATIGGFR